MSADEKGSAAILLVAVVGVASLIGILIGDVGGILAARARASAAADAAALAAAPVTFRPFGAGGSATREASIFAQANGASLTRCECATDRSFRPRDVTVEVAVAVATVLLGDRMVVATGRARFDPTRLGLPNSSFRVLSPIPQLR